MTIRVGINGFGRIGRLVMRAGWQLEEIEFVHINDPFIGLEGAAHLLQFDSVHGQWDKAIAVQGAGMQIGEDAIRFSEHKNPSEVDWQAYGVDIVLECSGQCLV